MIDAIDHIVITTKDVKACSDFYVRILGMKLINFGNKRIAFQFGDKKNKRSRIRKGNRT